ncbi:hypothetical protein [Microbacterium foliorum]|uniref:hypothetical protein n=1 Tax=Microbacterium foliorum TaxID=104336 RepID=UPI0009A06359|nr:hypothetical protein [Microbacterium foliorum]AQY02057.1 hypothetical protein B2G67_11675 [Microbacterium foliorum]
MSKQTEIAASDWLAVRERVVDKLKESSPRSEKDTRVRMAEGLILAGYVDVEFIAAEIAEEKRIREERAEAARVAHEEREASDSEQQDGAL